MYLSIELTNLKDLDEYIGRHWANHLQKQINKVAPVIQKRIQDRFRELLRVNTTISKILDGGDLFGELGVTDISEKIQVMLDTLIAGTLFTPQKILWNKTVGIRGGFTIQMVKTDYSEVLIGSQNLDIFRTPENAYDLPWLEWLLTSGNTRVVANYDFMQRGGWGRTGKGIMVEKYKRGYWSVPGDIECTPTNNFITQTIDAVLLEVDTIFREEIHKVL